MNVVLARQCSIKLSERMVEGPPGPVLSNGSGVQEIYTVT